MSEKRLATLFPGMGNGSPLDVASRRPVKEGLLAAFVDFDALDDVRRRLIGGGRIAASQ